MLIWRGKGLIVILEIIVASLMVVPLIAVWGLSARWTSAMDCVFSGLIAALINRWFAARFIDRRQRVFIDEETGQRVVFRDGSALFFIPVWVWTWIMGIGGVLFAIVNLTD